MPFQKIKKIEPNPCPPISGRFIGSFPFFFLFGLKSKGKAFGLTYNAEIVFPDDNSHHAPLAYKRVHSFAARFPFSKSTSQNNNLMSEYASRLNANNNIKLGEHEQRYQFQQLQPHCSSNALQCSQKEDHQDLEHLEELGCWAGNNELLLTPFRYYYNIHMTWFWISKSVW